MSNTKVSQFSIAILHSRPSRVVLLGVLRLPKLFKMEKERTRKILKNFLLQSHKIPQYSYLFLTRLCLINGKTFGLCLGAMWIALSYEFF